LYADWFTAAGAAILLSVVHFGGIDCGRLSATATDSVTSLCGLAVVADDDPSFTRRRRTLKGGDGGRGCIALRIVTGGCVGGCVVEREFDSLVPARRGLYSDDAEGVGFARGAATTAGWCVSKGDSPKSSMRSISVLNEELDDTDNIVLFSGKVGLDNIGCSSGSIAVHT
jgi:hypothetical protein